MDCGGLNNYRYLKIYLGRMLENLAPAFYTHTADQNISMTKKKKKIFLKR